MPAGDGTGPLGMGAMTGRAAGFCVGFGVPGYANPVPGRGLGMGFGRGRGGGFAGRGGGGGRGFRHCYYATGLPARARAGVPYPGMPTAAPAMPNQEVTALKQQAEYLGNALENVRRRIAELEAEPTEK